MKPIQTRLRRSLAALALTLYAGGSPGEDMADPASGNTSENRTRAPVANIKGKKQAASDQPPPPSLNGLAVAAANGGVVDCVGRIHQVTDFLTKDTKTGAFLFLAPTEANRSIASTSLEIQKNSISTYASASFAPVGATGCAALYETIAYWGNRCEDVARKVFPAFPVTGKLGTTTTMLDGGDAVRVFLMPIAQGCLSIKKELLY